MAVKLKHLIDHIGTAHKKQLSQELAGLENYQRQCVRVSLHFEVVVVEEVNKVLDA